MVDPRWVLARERTRLAWARFSMACSLLAIALAVFAPREVPTLLVVIPGGVVGLVGLVAAVRLFRR